MRRMRLRKALQEDRPAFRDLDARDWLEPDALQVRFLLDQLREPRQPLAMITNLLAYCESRLSLRALLFRRIGHWQQSH